jgi:hypothetical protein
MRLIVVCLMSGGAVSAPENPYAGGIVQAGDPADCVSVPSNQAQAVADFHRTVRCADQNGCRVRHQPRRNGNRQRKR